MSFTAPKPSSSAATRNDAAPKKKKCTPAATAPTAPDEVKPRRVADGEPAEGHPTGQVAGLVGNQREKEQRPQAEHEQGGDVAPGGTGGGGGSGDGPGHEACLGHRSGNWRNRKPNQSRSGADDRSAKAFHGRKRPDNPGATASFRPMYTAFRLTALPREIFASLFSLTDADLAARGVRRLIADAQPGYPCRVSLADAAPGEGGVAVALRAPTGGEPIPCRRSDLRARGGGSGGTGGG